MNENDFIQPQHITSPTPRKINSKIKRVYKADTEAHASNTKRTEKAKKSLRKKAKKEKDKKFVANVKQAIDKIPKEEIVKTEIIVESYKSEIPEQLIIWQPDPDNKPQIMFLEAPEEEVLFSGSRGSGKSDALIADPLRYVNNGNFKALIIRKTMKQLRELMSRARKMYLPAVPGTKWKEQEKLFVFPSGATIEFGYCDTDADADQYQGQQYCWLGIDEITQYATDYILETIKQSLRSTDPTLSIQVRATTNPNGPGHRWVKQRWIERGKSGEKIVINIMTDFGMQTITRKWIHSVTQDNSILMKHDPRYLASLSSIQNETLRRQWLFGDWDAAEGVAFSEFRKDTHVIKPFTIPPNWLRFRAADWGYSTMAACLWFAIDYDNNLYIYRELITGGDVGKKVDAPSFARLVLDLEKSERIKYGVLDCSTWSERGMSGPSIAEEMITLGCLWKMSDSSKGSRVAGKMQIHQYLKIDEYTKKPKLFIFENCKELIDELASLPLDENNPEDVDTDACDHAYDALRYGLMSRPQIASDYMWRADNGSYGSNANIVVSDSFGY